jgi:hypothetical protein
MSLTFSMFLLIYTKVQHKHKTKHRSQFDSMLPPVFWWKEGAGRYKEGMTVRFPQSACTARSSSSSMGSRFLCRLLFIAGIGTAVADQSTAVTATAKPSQR